MTANQNLDKSLDLSKKDEIPMTQSTEVKKTEPASPQSIQKPVEEAKTVKEGVKASKDNSTFVIVSDEGISII